MNVIKVENLSKRYSLGLKEKKADTLAGQAANIIKSPWENFKRLRQMSRFGEEDESIFWALKDINFEVKEGEVLGIIGKNGAGKSTLLKILSQITEPTSGRIEIKGRVASLLEVGTGFHPELSGRDNIYMNGTILGMTKREIDSKLDEIIDFSGVEKFIDTPVKFYSSGMKVRLGFSVAAHLEPELLIIDEVLAVGDYEFQKKCLGKMKDVSEQGRTVLFVSHNLVSVKALCTKCIFLKNGGLFAEGNVNEVVQLYQEGEVSLLTEQNWEIGAEAPGNEKIRIKRAAVYAQGKTSLVPITTADKIVMEFDFLNYMEKANIDVTVDIFDSDGAHVTHFGMVCNKQHGLQKGLYRTRGILPSNLLNTKRYIFHVMFGLNQREVLYRHEDILTIDIEDGIANRGSNFSKLPGIIHPLCPWETISIQ